MYINIVSTVTKAHHFTVVLLYSLMIAYIILPSDCRNHMGVAVINSWVSMFKVVKKKVGATADLV